MPAKKNNAQPKRFPWIAIILILAATVGSYLAFRPALTEADSSPSPVRASETQTAASSPAQQESAGQEKLVGHWLRPDGGYILEIRAAFPDGKLTAGYFNPNPINVGRAEWKKKDGKLQVFVELRDVNYPGSTYTLDVSAKGDQMSGNYYQATQQQNFPVEFIKQR